ncbi:Domain of uncharacterised function (DUF3786([[Clostridium] sordellii]|uniref:DUF3786 domain-containing protein n=1 Tax=Paraclostridium sordellii TaxID=1505 RepID=A0ABP1XTV1_PARSO|nr:DUF3786 domain-containing protein [Paeniclostridium sordellii]CEJ72764.1 conserved hypothetical protein [[Clostridium] sordellii] [Paeniclostridium sordellii]CEN68317.1 Domain of uncharacterised function (DUF3786) [[Clostridium] sordellii] [Paeniclostridium sordellii]CEN71584.1 Domain of uncharacterised function (DUF3786) [[Clostridium] sordellii] [Paeniclostridium sordellii]CEO21809.1 Domain of uncharacterised function (DUF3786) [[Clostridium] sordellii] [Paeniclostridium sordellii]CEP7682
MKNDLNEGNYKLVLENLIMKFKSLNPIVISKLTNSFYNNKSNTFKLRFLDSNIYIHYPSGVIYKNNKKLNEDISLNILVIRFLINGIYKNQTNIYLSYKETAGGYVYYSNFKSRTIKYFINKYKDDFNLLKKHMEKIKAEKLDMGDISYKVRFLNEIYVVFILWYGDEEFEAEGNILFDYNINSYFNAEDLAVIPDIILNNLK